MYQGLRRALFQLEPEASHRIALAGLAPFQSLAPLRRLLSPAEPSPRLRMRALGREFANPLGMAAGFDKECGVHNVLLALGFGHVEVGTVTPRPQPGNDPPRMQRLVGLEAVVNRLGFPGPGAEVAARGLSSNPPTGTVGANIGPNKTTAPDDVGSDLAACASALAPHVAYLAINVSSPNTPGLRALQEPTSVAAFVGRVLDAAAIAGHRRPVLLKVHPDAADEELVAVARAAVDAGASGIVATNTTRARPAGTETAMEGGLSGAPLRARAREVIAALHRGLGREVPIIGVGGVASGADAMGHIMAGATLVQAYTGFIYRGPRMPAMVAAELVAELDRLGLDRLEEAVGKRGPATA